MTSKASKREEEILKFWDDKSVFSKLQQKNKDGKPFNFIEGPPFPTGEAHLGHLRNWAIKDSVLRYKRFEGYKVYARDGYDVHGLPVEAKVQSKLGLKTVDDVKKFGEEKFVAECKKYIAEIIEDMKGVRRRYGLWMDFNHYQTSHPEYLSMAWRFFKEAEKKGLLYKDYKTVAWSPGAETTLSDYEIKDEYKVLEDPSIYVKFPLKKEYWKTKTPEYLVIWTTTPWTLQSNMAIAMHKDIDYSRVLVELNGHEEILILADVLVPGLMKVFSKSNKITMKKVLSTAKGSQYEAMRYDHILLDETPSQKEFAKNSNKKIHSVLLADFVTVGEGESVLERLEKKSTKHSISSLSSNKENNSVSALNVPLPKVITTLDEAKKITSVPHDPDVYEPYGKEESAKKEGTGLVHIAPGHGFDDYELGKKNGIPIFSPVDSKAIITEGQFKGHYFKDADVHVIAYLKEKGFMLHNGIKKHKYPLCWRTKVPIVYRAVDQWWIKRSEITEKIVAENSKVEWYPDFARQGFNHLMLNAGDWPISRQRFWGIPLPIFEDEDGNYDVFGSKEELEAKVGKKLVDIHRDDLKGLSYKNPKSGKMMKAVPFIADVWFDSGCASFASHYGEGLSFEEIIKKYYPITWITESEDQVRGWFSSLFNVGYMVTGHAPYKELLYYKFVMDKEGKKMSKSLGNGITGNESIEKWGADGTRYYLLTKRAPEDQINFDPEEMGEVGAYFNTLENIFKLINPYVEEHIAKKATYDLETLDVEDLWILYRLNVAVRTYREEMKSYRLHAALKSLEEFVVRDFSKTYLKIVKERMEEKDEDLVLIFSEILKKTLVLLSIACPFLSEDIYQKTFFPKRKESVFLEDKIEANEKVITYVEKKKLQENFDLALDLIQAVLHARETRNIGLRWPLGKIDIASSENLKNKLEPYEKLIKKLTNIVDISYDVKGVKSSVSVKPNFAGIKTVVKDPSPYIKTINMNKTKIEADIANHKKEGTFDGLHIDYEKHLLKEMSFSETDYASAKFLLGTVLLETKQDEILLEEGYLRELIRRVQDIRKNLDLNKKDVIDISFEGSDEYFKNIIDDFEDMLKKKLGIRDILSHRVGKDESFDIKDKTLVVSIKKVA